MSHRTLPVTLVLALAMGVLGGSPLPAEEKEKEGVNLLEGNDLAEHWTTTGAGRQRRTRGAGASGINLRR